MHCETLLFQVKELICASRTWEEIYRKSVLWEAEKCKISINFLQKLTGNIAWRENAILFCNQILTLARETQPFNLYLDFRNQGLEKLGQGLFQTLEKFKVLHTWIFFSLSPGFHFRFARPEIFLSFEASLDFSSPWFSEIKVQIKRPIYLPI